LKIPEGADVIPATAKDTTAPKFVTSFNESYSISEGQSCHLEARLTPVDDPKMKVSLCPVLLFTTVFYERS
jgi:hypothetical protein